MISFYEENGIPPATYVTQENDDIRTFSKKLLGAKDSWKEVWATNPTVESKGKVPAGLEIHYWPENTEVASASKTDKVVAAGAVAAAGNPPPSDPTAGPDQGLSDSVPDAAMNNPAGPTGAAGGAQANMPQPQAGAAAGMNQPPQEMAMNNMPPPPPQPAQQPMQMAPPPPPPPPPVRPAQQGKKPAQVADATTTDTDQTMMLGAGGLLLLGGVLAFSVIRRKKAAKQRIDMTQTQV
jgi:LPXTG-motif cell wall-anchored protein